MSLEARERVTELAAALSLVSLGVVFAAALGHVPATLLPRAPGAVVDAIPHVNAVLSTVAIGTIAGGVLAIRRGRAVLHRRLMLTSTGLFATFLVLYLYRLVLHGPAPFPGPQSLYRTVYLPTLAVHVLLAVVCVPLLYYVLLLALTRPVAALSETPHRTVGRVAAPLWLVSFALGDVVYLLLYVVY